MTPDLQEGVLPHALARASQQHFIADPRLGPERQERDAGRVDLHRSGPIRHPKRDGSYRGAHRARFDGAALDPVIAVRVRRAR